MDKGRFLIETHLQTGRPITELAAAHDVSRGWLYKLLARYRREGEAGLDPRSRRPRTSPSRIADLYEDEIVRIRKELAEEGFDAGAETIHFHMATPGREVPSVSTIYRVLPPGASSPLSRTSGPRVRGPGSRRSSLTSAGRPTSPTSRWPTVSSTRSSMWSTTTRACASRPGLRHHPLARRRAHRAQGRCDLGLSPALLDRQRANLHHSEGIEGRRTRARAGEPRHHDEALETEPSSDLREGRALPPDAQEVPRQARARHHQEVAPRTAHSFRRPRTTRSGPIAASVGAPPSRHTVHERRWARSAHASRPPAIGSATTRWTEVGQ